MILIGLFGKACACACCHGVMAATATIAMPTTGPHNLLLAIILFPFCTLTNSTGTVAGAARGPCRHLAPPAIISTAVGGANEGLPAFVQAQSGPVPRPGQRLTSPTSMSKRSRQRPTL